MNAPRASLASRLVMVAVVAVVAAAAGCNDAPLVREVTVAGDTGSAVGPYEVRATAFSADGLTSATLRVDDGDRAALVIDSPDNEDGSDFRLRGDIGGRPIGTRVRFAVVVCDPAGRCATDPADFPVDAWEFVVGAASALAISAVNPDRGPESGGTVVDVRGSDFREGEPPRVFFGDIAAPHVERVRADLLRVTTPRSASGLVDVTVAQGDGASVVSGAFTFTPVPTVSEVRPASGPEAGGTAIAIRGSGFHADDRVFVDGIPCRGVVFSSSEFLSCETPPGLGTVDVTVVLADGGAGALVDAFRFIAPPRVDAVTPDSGNAEASERITVVGTGFLAGAVVTVGGTPCLDVILTDGGLSCTVAPGAPGLADVVVTNFDGQVGVLAGGYARLGPPIVVLVDPDRGPTTGGIEVRIFGSGLADSDAVFFGDDAALVIEANNDAELVVILPQTTASLSPPPPDGLVFVDVTVVRTRADDQRSGFLTDGFAYVLPPVVTAVSPASGPVAGNTDVVIRGRFFTPGTEVTFDGAACVALVFVSATELRCFTPPGEAGPADVAAFDFVAAGIVDFGTVTAAAYTYVPPPRVDSIAPSEGPTFGGDVVTIRGAFFLPGALAFIDGAPCSGAVVVDAQTLRCTTPAGQRGPADVRVVNVDNQEDTAAGIYEYVGVAVTPDHGLPVGFTRVSVRAAGFDPAVRVFFDDIPAVCSFVSSREVTCQTPTHNSSTGTDSIGPVVVRFANPNGTGDEDVAFTYTEFRLRNRAIDNGDREPNHVAIADADADGDLDVFVANGRIGTPEDSAVFLNNGAFAFSERTLPGTTVVGNKVDVGSINADGIPDLVISASSDVGAVLLRSSGPAEWVVVELPLVRENSSFDAQLVDVIGDDRDDLLVLDIGCEQGDPENPDCDPAEDGIDVLFEQTGENGGSVLSRRPNVIPHERGQTHDHKFVVSDLDGDGDNDVVIVVNNTAFPTAQNRVLRNRVSEGLGFVKETSTLSRLRGDLYDIDAGDIDGDGDDDVITSICAGDGAVSSEVLLRNDNGTLLVDETAVPTFRADCTVGAKMVDVDDDGDLDLFWAGSLSINDPRLIVRLYVNRGDGTFVDASAFTPVGNRALEGSNLACGDLDGDGDVDCVVAGGAPLITPDAPGRVLVLEQRGDARPEP